MTQAETKRSRKGSVQVGLAAWVEGIIEHQHDCANDALWTSQGQTPPCKLSPRDPGYEPVR